MQKHNNLTWKEAFQKSPGPKNWREAGILFVKGICMGSADIIPGVSGGTIALIVGIYEKLIDAIQSVNTEAIFSAIKLNLKNTLQIVHIRFLLSLLLGIATAILSLTHLIHYLLDNHPVHIWSFFLGLIAASAIAISKNIPKWSVVEFTGVLLGTLGGYLITGLIPAQTPETWWFVMFSGMIAICAMILPGISGAFILLIMGKYQYVTSALKNPFTTDNIIIIVTFLIGCVIGILGFSRVLNYLLKKHHNFTITFLIGLMIGSLRKVWPWKETLETITIRDKVYVLREQNILPQSYDSAFFIACLLIIIGFIFVLLLERLANKREL
ncbi:MAG: DUF368 domain-containing protein [Leptospiraceae bacterium]|nr:DUF368 domain-containing protein [Leptospiraceae bacterium]